MPKITSKSPMPPPSGLEESKPTPQPATTKPPASTPALPNFASDQIDSPAPANAAPAIQSPLGGMTRPEDSPTINRTTATVPLMDTSIMEGLRDSLPTCSPPDDSSLRKAWADFRKNPSGSSGARQRLEQTFSRLTAQHDKLTSKSRQYGNKLSKLERMSRSSSSRTRQRAHRDAKSLKTEGRRYQGEVKEFQQEVKEFLEQVKSTSASPRQSKLSSEAQALLDSLGPIAKLPDGHNQAYASFIADYGEDVASKHNLDGSVENLRQNVEILNGNASNLRDQKQHVTELLEQASSTRELKRIKKHIDYLRPFFDRHTNQVEGFQESVDNFVSFVEGLRTDKEAAKVERQKTSERKTEMLTELDGFLALDYDNTAFKDEYLALKDAIGAESLSKTGLDRNFDVMVHNLSNVQDSLHHVRNYAQMLHDDISKADHMGWLDARVESIESLRSQHKDFESSRDSFESQLETFISQLREIRGKSASAPFSSQLDAAKTRLTQAPGEVPLGDTITSPYESAVQGFTGHKDAAQWTRDYEGLAADRESIDISSSLLAERRSDVEGLLERAQSPSDLAGALKEISAYSEQVRTHNSEVRTYQRRADRFIDSLPGTTSSRGLRKERSAELSSAAKTLLSQVENTDTAIFDTLNISSLSYSDGRVLAFTAEDRIAIWDTLLSKPDAPSINARDDRGNCLLHNIILSASLDETEKLSMVEALLDHGVDVNLPDSSGLPPVEVALRLTTRDPQVIDCLRDHGGHVSERRRVPLLAHLLGTGGHLDVKAGGKSKNISLEGLSPTFAAYGLDPAFSQSMREVEERSHGEMKSVLHTVEHAWVDTPSYGKFIGRLKDAQAGIDTSAGGPEVLMTGWDHPSGHAVGFVFNQEGENHYLYACNAGDAKDPHRSIVKYKVKNFGQLVRFFRGCDQNRDQTRALFVGKPARMGLGRVPEHEQLPSSIDKSSQKRGNCTMASRKACMLAMMWSESLDHGIKPKMVKQHYKQVTTELRERGVRGAIDTGHQGLMGKALVKMLTKFDRTECQGYAYEVASAIVRQDETGSSTPAGGHPVDVPPTDAGEFFSTIEKALQITRTPLDARDGSGRTFIEHARHKDKPEVVAIFERLGA